jgi:hypothetical protein
MQGNPATFLGFTHIWGKSRAGKNVVRQVTAKNRYARALAAVTGFSASRRRARRDAAGQKEAYNRDTLWARIVPELGEAKLAQSDRLRVGSSAFSLRETFEQLGNAGRMIVRGLIRPEKKLGSSVHINELSLVEANRPPVSTLEPDCVQSHEPLHKHAAAGPRLSRVPGFQPLGKSLQHNREPSHRPQGAPATPGGQCRSKSTSSTFDQQSEQTCHSAALAICSRPRSRGRLVLSRR